MSSAVFYSDDESKFPLAPCPFCGGQAILQGAFGSYHVECMGAGELECPAGVSTDGAATSPASAAAQWNERHDIPGELLREVVDGLAAHGGADGVRPGLYALCIALGQYGMAESLCRLIYFMDSNHVIAARSLKEILEDASFARFHDRLRRKECYELSWDSGLKGIDASGVARTYTPVDLVPSGGLPALVWGD